MEYPNKIYSWKDVSVKFGVNLLNLLKKPNIVLSPYSIQSALFPCYYGATGEPEMEFELIFGTQIKMFYCPIIIQRYSIFSIHQMLLKLPHLLLMLFLINQTLS